MHTILILKKKIIKKILNNINNLGFTHQILAKINCCYKHFNNFNLKQFRQQTYKQLEMK